MRAIGQTHVHKRIICRTHCWPQGQQFKLQSYKYKWTAKSINFPIFYLLQNIWKSQNIPVYFEKYFEKNYQKHDRRLKNLRQGAREMANRINCLPCTH